MRDTNQVFDATGDFVAIALHVCGDGVSLFGFQVEKGFDQVAVDKVARGFNLAAKFVPKRAPCAVLEATNALNVSVHARLKLFGEFVDVFRKTGQDTDDAVGGAE